MSEHVGYLSETFADYNHCIDDAMTVCDIRECTVKFRRFADDAYRAASKMKESEWKFFRKGLREERKGKFAGNEWAAKYGAILLPEVMMRIGMLAVQFHVPWGCAFLRAKQCGIIEENDGIVRLVNKEAL